MSGASKSLGAVCILVIGIYTYMAQSSVLELLNPNPAESYYNLLVEGFRSGHLSLKKDVPRGLTELADPYDPTANEHYRLGSDHLYDLSYYEGRLYLYFGVTPALILFWPFTAMTGEYLFHRQAVAIFCTVGFLASVGLLRALWRRYFVGVSPGVVGACALALGLATGMPVILSRVGLYDVAISCGYMLTMLALGAIWCALHETERRCWWLAAASVAYGLAVGARPSLLFGGIIVLVPVAEAWRERRPVLPLLAAATVPLILLGLGLMLYNARRFDSPFEFGVRYQLSGQRQVMERLFSLHYLWFNFRVYFLEPACWSGRFPFAHDIRVPPLPTGYTRVETPFGVLTNIPVVWLALAAPLAWRGRFETPASILRWFVTAAALLFGTCALTVVLFNGAVFRYEADFLPALVLLAVMGILGMERALAATPESGLTDRPVWRRAARCGWGLLLGFSVVFNLLVSVEHYAEAYNELGIALMQSGKTEDAIGQYKQALQINPESVEAHVNLGSALLQMGKVQDAVGEYKQALRINPSYAEAHNNLGAILQRVGKLPEAIQHYERALRSKPEYVDAHFNMGLALEKMGRVPEAIEHYEQALKLRPDFTPASNALARLRAGQ